MSHEDILNQLENLKAEIKANPSAAEFAGPRLREIISRARTEVDGVIGWSQRLGKTLPFPLR